VKCLSVRQPWAWAIIHGTKDIENRNWKTDFRGLLAIHAGKALDMKIDELADMARGDYGEPWTSMALGYGNAYDSIGDDDPRGAIIGVVEVVGCTPSYACDSPWKAGPDPDYFCLNLRNPRALKEPIPLKGQLGLFNLPPHIVEMIEVQK
jgi:hypothetical protein